MKKAVIQFSADEKKVIALRIFLSEKPGNLEAELTDYLDGLYKKAVPANVREYIDRYDGLESQTQKVPPRRSAHRKPVSGDVLDTGTDTAKKN